MPIRKSLQLSYRAIAMGQAQHLATAHALFVEAHANDASVLDQARAELSRCEAVSQQCFVSKTNAQFLRQAIAAMEAKINPES